MLQPQNERFSLRYLILVSSFIHDEKSVCGGRVERQEVLRVEKHNQGYGFLTWEVVNLR